VTPEKLAEVRRLVDEARRTGAIDLGGGRLFYLRCGKPTAQESRITGRVFERPCLMRRDHGGECSPRWDGA
jgi:hypothetical protein